MNPEEILARKALAEPHRAYAGRGEREMDQIQALSLALKVMMKKEFGR